MASGDRSFSERGRKLIKNKTSLRLQAPIFMEIKQPDDIHVMPTWEGHEENENCWCQPTWDPENKVDYGSGLAKVKMWVHRLKKDCEQ